MRLIFGRMATIVVALALVTMMGPLVHGQGFDLQLTYGVYAKGLRGLNVEIDLVVEEARYIAKFDARTAGLVSWFVDWQIQAESEGAIDGDMPAPDFYKTRNQRRDTERWVEISYPDVGAPEVSSKPSVADDGRPALSAELTTGTIDPISALVGFLLATSRGLAAGDDQICPGPFAVFDGRRRYDVTGSAIDARHFPGSGIAPYAGDAFGCQLELAKLGGFKASESDNRDVLNSQITMWLGDAAAVGVLLPVRLDMRSRAGRTLVHLQRVRDRRGTVVFGES